MDHRRAGQAAAPELGDGVEHRLANPGQSVAVHEHAEIGAERATLVDRAELDPVHVGLDAILDVRREHPHVVPGIAPRNRMAAIGAQRQVTRDPLRRTAYRTLQGDEPAGQHGLVADHGIDARNADVGAHGPLILLGGMEVLHDGPEHLLRQFLGFAIAHAHERLLDVVRQGRRREPMRLVRCFFEQCLGDPAGGG